MLCLRQTVQCLLHTVLQLRAQLLQPAGRGGRVLFWGRTVQCLLHTALKLLLQTAVKGGREGIVLGADMGEKWKGVSRAVERLWDEGMHSP